uniref:thioredoxin-dependent peroxiredoxin n=1 Tax=Musca domestica TaxID=7370 RepID=A0A1I8MWR5_MUSDO
MSFLTRTLLRTLPQVGKQLAKQQNVNNSFRRLLHQTSPLLAVKVQQPAPDFKGIAVLGNDFQDVQLSDYAGKYLVLFFYPLDFTFVCPTEIIAFSDRIQEFKDLNAEVLGVSVDSHFSHLVWSNMERKNGGLGGLKYPLLADITKQISADYGVLLENEGISLRGTFIIDPNGVVRQYSINDLPVGRSVDEVLRLIKAFQFVEKHGEVCPANWNPESNPDTIKPDVEQSKEYFNKHG